MNDLNATALSVLDRDELAASVVGPVLLPADDGYAAENAVFNLSVDHRPGVVVGATCAADVAASVRFAAGRGLSVAVLCTGHGPSLAMDESVVLVTTRRMTGVTIDPSERTATVEAGVCWQQVVEEAVKYGLAPLTGSSPGVGVVGYTLGGGLSVTMARAFGWAADHVSWLEVITADGQLRRVSPDHEPELFWALRGGRSNYGVVTAMKFGLFPVDRLFAGSITYAGESAREVLHAYAQLAEDAPDELTSSIALLRLPDLPFLPEFMRGRLTVNVRVSYLGSARDGEKLIKTLRSVAPVLMDTVTDIPYGEYSSIIADPGDPGAAVEHFALLRELRPEGIDSMVDAVNSANSARVNIVDIRQLGGALRAKHANRGAMGTDDAEFAMFVLTFVAPEEVLGCAKSGLNVIEALGPSVHEQKHPNFLSPADAGPDGTRAAFSPETYRMLRTVKAEYDPDNLFQFNHNIPPR